MALLELPFEHLHLLHRIAENIAIFHTVDFVHIIAQIHKLLAVFSRVSVISAAHGSAVQGMRSSFCHAAHNV